MKKAVRPVFFVHESMPANTLFFKLEREGIHGDIGQHEDGRMDGMNTIRDLHEL